MLGPTLGLQARRVERFGFRTDCGFNYASVTGTLSMHARRLAEHVANLDTSCLHLVGHSMGTLVILKMLAECRDSRIGRSVLLSPPYRGSAAGRALAAFRPGRWILGRSASLWLQEEQVPPAQEATVGVIAGTLPVGIGVLLGVLESPHDSVVMVRETVVPGMRDHITLPVSHVGMLLAPAVAEQTCTFLEHGHFHRSGALSEVA